VIRRKANFTKKGLRLKEKERQLSQRSLKKYISVSPEEGGTDIVGGRFVPWGGLWSDIEKKEKKEGILDIEKLHFQAGSGKGSSRWPRFKGSRKVRGGKRNFWNKGGPACSIYCSRGRG